VYVLNKLGVPSGKGSTIVITRLLTITLLTFIGGIFSIFIFRDSISNNPVLSFTFLISGILVFIIFAILLTALLFPPFMQIIIRIIGKIGNVLKIIKDKEKFDSNTTEELINMQKSFINFFSKHLGYFIIGCVCFGVFYFINILILIEVLKGLNVTFAFKEGFALCALLFFLISFMPTPGASGMGEGVFVIIFSGKIPIYLIGIAVILWRTFYQYLTALFGSIYSARFFSKLFEKENKAK
jgi:uncharacterized protein (TIRG00374 family)